MRGRRGTGIDFCLEPLGGGGAIDSDVDGWQQPSLCLVFFITPRPLEIGFDHLSGVVRRVDVEIPKLCLSPALGSGTFT